MTSDHLFNFASLCFSVKFTYSTETKGRLHPLNNGQNLVQNPAFLYAIEQGKIKIYVTEIWPVFHMNFISKSMGLV